MLSKRDGVIHGYDSSSLYHQIFKEICFKLCILTSNTSHPPRFTPRTFCEPYINPAQASADKSEKLSAKLAVSRERRRICIRFKNQ